ncbi:MAG: type IV pili methyl-accepting chemotaxis transducer N-terminal domain-containing protein [Cytophagales bacterium]|nr:type IV pili methyl-accepting chemotaxis transducer N-terminal domain-containing protein [Cytophagales bacterium]
MRTLTSKYITVLAILTIAIMASQLFMQKTINDSKTDARIINISGRQRMLSQKITKASLKLSSAQDVKEFESAKSELTKALQLWSSSHEKLQSGNAELDVSQFNESVQLRRLFAAIEPHFDTIRLAAMYLINSEYDLQTDAATLTTIQSNLDQITENEAPFLDLMNQITFEYDRLASNKISFLSKIEYGLLGITLLLIVIEVLLVFLPMFKSSKVKDQKIDELNSILDEEKSFATGQIDQANKMIHNLRKIARKLKLELDQNQKNHALSAGEQLKLYLDLKEQNTRLKENNDLLKMQFREFSGKHLSNN